MSSKTVILSSELRSRVNQIAHTAGQKHAIDMRAKLLQDLQRLAQVGATAQAMREHLDTFEASK